MTDRRLLGATLHAPSHLSGLSDNEYNILRAEPRRALRPVQVDVQTQLVRALEKLSVGVAAARRLLLQRCELRKDSDGALRGIDDLQPEISLVAG